MYLAPNLPFLGETKRKFESVYTGGIMDTPDSFFSIGIAVDLKILLTLGALLLLTPLMMTDIVDNLSTNKTKFCSFV